MGFIQRFISKEDDSSNTPVEDAVQLDTSETGGQGEPLDQLPGDEENKPVEDENTGEGENTKGGDEPVGDEGGETGDNPSTDLDEGTDGAEGEGEGKDENSEDQTDDENTEGSEEGSEEGGDLPEGEEGDNEEEGDEPSDEDKEEAKAELEAIKELVQKDARNGGIAVENVATLDLLLKTTLAKVGLESETIMPSTSKFLTPSTRMTSTNVVLQGIEYIQNRLG